ncbi:MAG: alkaline phosphatase family protein [Blastocatellia bacterium]|nr:alkaline phosphatase family protein [Blastocatellia bacterium]
MKERVLVIGIDGTTFDWIDPLMEAGKLPNLARINREGARSQLETVFPPITSTAWTSFATGKNPGKHGILEFIQRRGGNLREMAANATQRTGKALWEILGDAGKRVIVTNFPVTYPPRPVNGVLVTDFMTPRGRRDITYPNTLLQEIEDKFGPYRLYLTQTYAKGNVDGVLDEVFDEVDYKSKVNRYLMERDDWDFLITHIWGTDRLQHETWHVMDQSHPRHDSAEFAAHRARILEFWQKVDAEVGNMVTAAGPQTTVVLASDHGFGPAHKYCAFNIWLLQEGFLKLKRTAQTRIKQMMFSLGVTPELAFKVSRQPLFKKLRPSRGVGTQSGTVGKLNQFFLSFNDVDWSRTVAFSKGNYGQIFINLKGREPHGIIEEAQYEEVRDRIVKKLRAMRTPDTGEPFIGEIFTREELYQGEHLPDAPDVCFLPRDMRYVSLGNMDFTSNRFIVDAFGNSGTHRMNGILLVHGPHVRRGARLEKAKILDCAPTILHLLGQPVPEDMDGRVLTEILSDDFMRSHPVSVGEAATGEDLPDIEFSDEESDEVRERLRELGYLG